MESTPTTNPDADVVLPTQRHDHDECITQALENAEAICQERDVRLTALRRQVLELIWQNHKPLGAYAILEALQHAQERRAAPPTVYRALDFLLENGLIHRLDSLNAYIGCPHPEHAHIGQFMICLSCENVMELDTPTITKSVREHAESLGFKVQQQTIEIAGQCAQCQELQV
ncbi:MAG: Fur family transcriptional regulator [Pseudomonadota bacterium]